MAILTGKVATLIHSEINDHLLACAGVHISHFNTEASLLLSKQQVALTTDCQCQAIPIRKATTQQGQSAPAVKCDRMLLG
jgi:hypothetical protein